MFGTPAPSLGSGGLFLSTPTNTGGQFQATPAANTGGLFSNASQGAQSGGLFGNNQNAQQQNTGGGIFGSTPQPNSSRGLFGSSQQQPATGGGMFGNSQQQPASGGLFGNSQQQPSTGGGMFGSSQQQPSTGGGLFGNSQQQPSTGGLFGNSQQQPSTGGGMFGNSQQPSTGGLFGNSQQQPFTGGLFGGNQNNATGGGLFGGASTTQGISGGMFGNPGNNGGLNGNAGVGFVGSSSMNQQGVRPFPGAFALFAYADASDLRFGPVPEGIPAEDQNKRFEESVRAGIIPDDLRKQLIDQQNIMTSQRRQLESIQNQSNTDVVTLLERTARMEQSVLQLRSSIMTQAEKIKSLRSDVSSMKAIDEALHEARRMASRSRYTVKKSVPSNYFWELLQSLENHFVHYEERTRELVVMLNTHSRSNKGGRTPMHKIIAILQKQYQGFKAISNLVAEAHEKMNELREQYKDYYLNSHGDIPRDFELEDTKEKEHRRKQLRKIDEQANIWNQQSNQVSGQPTNQFTGSVNYNTGGNFGSTTTTAGLFGGANAAPSTGLFGSTGNAAPSTGLFGSNTGNSTNGTSLFGSTNAAPSTGLFGSTTGNSTTAPPSNGTSLFGGTNAAPSTGLFGSAAAAPPNTGLFGSGGNSSSSFAAPQLATDDSFGNDVVGAPRKGSRMASKKNQRRKG